MKIYCLILSFILTFVTYNVSGQARRALIIGIGNYPKEFGWNPIHGNNDISIIKESLIRQGFSLENIMQIKDTAATKNNILSAFEKLTESCHQGDVVYIHFSGHGQQVTDLDGDEDDGFDEAWIPYDAQKEYVSGVYEGENHLTDDELNVILTRLRVCVGVKGKIIVVADACHSGSGSRGKPSDEVFIRGTGDKFIIPRKSVNIHKKPKTIEWLFVAACKPYQSNYEYRTQEGEYYGVLSYIIASETKRFDAYKYMELLQEWSDNISKLSRYPQNIDNEGQPNRKNSYMF